MIWHQTVSLSTSPGSDTVDRYGRLLRYVELGGRDVGLAMIQAGRASEYHLRTAATESRAAEYVAAQSVAMREKRGQWATCTLAQEGKQ